MNTLIRSLALPGAAALALAGCHDAAPVTEETAAATGNIAQEPEALPGVSAQDGKLVLPAVPGRPGAVYFTLRNAGAEAVTLAGVDVTGAAKAEMHETSGGTMRSLTEVELAPGELIAFKPGGHHVMAFGLPEKVSEAELTLTFSSGDKISLPLNIEKMGANMGAMEGMRH